MTLCASFTSTRTSQILAKKGKMLRSLQRRRPYAAVSRVNGPLPAAGWARRASNAKEPAKPAADTSSKKSSFPILPVVGASAVVALAFLAYKQEQGSGMAAHIAEQPGISFAVAPFVSLVRAAGLGAKDEDISEPPAVPTKVAVKETIVDLPSTSEKESPSTSATEPTIQKEEEEVTAVTEDNDDAEVDIFEEAVTQDIISSDPTKSEATEEKAVDNNTHPAAVAATPKPTAPSLPETGAETIMKTSRSGGTSAKAAEILNDATKSSLVLRQEIESLLLKNIHTMDADALRLRVTQLATELFERLAWENVRLNHALRQVEEDLNTRYESLMAKQRTELEFEVTRLLFKREKELTESSAESVKALEEKYQDQLQAAIKAQAEGFQATLTAELKAQQERMQNEIEIEVNALVAGLRKQQTEELLALQPKIEQLSTQLQAYHKLLDGLGNEIEATFNTHAVSTAILTLESALSQPNRSKQVIALNFEQVKRLCSDDDLVVAVLNALPTRVKTQGALTLSELQVRFQVMRDEARKAALAPENAPKILGQMIGTILATMSFVPSGYIAGNGPEETLARAAYFLDRGKLKESVAELQTLKGYVKVVTADWIQSAEDRLVVNQAIRTLKAESIIRHRNLQK